MMTARGHRYKYRRVDRMDAVRLLASVPIHIFRHGGKWPYGNLKLPDGGRLPPQRAGPTHSERAAGRALGSSPWWQADLNQLASTKIRATQRPPSLTSGRTWDVLLPEIVGLMKGTVK